MRPYDWPITAESGFSAAKASDFPLRARDGPRHVRWIAHGPIGRSPELRHPQRQHYGHRHELGRHSGAF